MNKFNSFLSLFSLSITCLILSGCSEIIKRKSYSVYFIASDTMSLEGIEKVILNGREVGSVDRISELALQKKILKASIDENVRIPLSSEVSCFESILGGGYISVTYLEGKNYKSFLQDNDTVLVTTKKGARKLDSFNDSLIVKELMEVKNVLDSSFRKIDSTLRR